MARNMNVAVTLRLQDQFTGPVRALMQHFQQLTRAAQDFNRAAGAGSRSPFGRMQQEVRSLTSDVRNLVGQMSQLGRAMGTGAGGSFAGRQVADMRQLLGLQQQAIVNNARMAAAPPGVPRMPGTPGAPGSRGGGIFGRSGFNPNASVMDRMQYRAVNEMERSFVEGALDLDRARTNLLMLANPRPNPHYPDHPFPGVISPETFAQIEREAVTLTEQFRSLNRAHVLDTFKELVTQFRTPESAFALLPMMLAAQEWQVIGGSTVEQARSGNASLLRAMGLSGRLVDNDGNLLINRETGRPEALEFLENFIRARAIGGRDITPDQVFQVMKYLKTTGQTMNQDALLMSFIGMPDIRGSTFGNSLDQLRLQLTGRATKEAQAAQAAGGLITGRIRRVTPGGPQKFVRESTIDEHMLLENPFEWFNRHIMGPQGYLRKVGVDPMTGSAAQIASALSRILSRATAANIAAQMVLQQPEWRTQVESARRLNLSPEALESLGSQSAWYQMQSARSKLQDAMGSVANNFKILLPFLEQITKQMGKIAAFVDPDIGNPLAGMGILGSALLAGGFLALRGAARMNPLFRMLLAGGAGFLLTGSPLGAMMGGMMASQMGGAAAAAGGGRVGGGAVAAAGAVGALAGRSLASRLMAAVRIMFRGFIPWTIAFESVRLIWENWEAFKTRMVGIFNELKAAAPTWLGGEAKGLGALGSTGTGFAAIPQDLEQYRQSWGAWLAELGIRDWIANNSVWVGSGLPRQRELARLSADAQATMAMGFPAASGTVTIGSVTNHVTVQVASSNADPNAIGEAAGNAVGNALRTTMADIPGLY